MQVALPATSGITLLPPSHGYEVFDPGRRMANVNVPVGVPEPESVPDAAAVATKLTDVPSPIVQTSPEQEPADGVSVRVVAAGVTTWLPVPVLAAKLESPE